MSILLAILVVSGCSESTAPPTGGGAGDPQAPELPGAEVMQFDLRFFGTPEAAAAQAQACELAGGACSRSHWFNAVVRVAAIELIVAAGMTPPTAAFVAATRTIPSYLGDLTWLWIYTWIDAQGREMQVRLQGCLLEEADAVAWELRASSEATSPPLEQALWFQGESPIGYGSGTWVINDLSAEPPQPVVQLDFSNPSDEEHELCFENINPADPGFGDTLCFHELGSLCTLEFYDADEGETARIAWDEASGSGSLECPDYQGGEPACWDAEGCDCDCPTTEPE